MEDREEDEGADKEWESDHYVGIGSFLISQRDHTGDTEPSGSGSCAWERLDSRALGH